MKQHRIRRVLAGNFIAMSHKLSCLSLVVMAVLSLTVVAVGSVQAQPTSPCDPEYMDALEARAWMEAQREIAQNQNLIFKPDSVLEYTCFDRFLGRVVSNSNYTQTDRIFSETNRWGAVPGFTATTTDQAVEVVVLSSLDAWIRSNYQHTFLDERSSLDYTVPGSLPTTGSYTCDRMGLVWNAARCMEFMDEAATDGFFDFSWYENQDPRQVRPAAYQCPNPQNLSIDGQPALAGMAAARNTAFNRTPTMFDVVNEPITDGNPYLEDPVVSHLQMILPVGGCAGAVAVPTGVRVQRSDVNGGNPYDEHVCTKPGCSATPAGTCVP